MTLGPGRKVKEKSAIKGRKKLRRGTQEPLLASEGYRLKRVLRNWREG